MSSRPRRRSLGGAPRSTAAIAAVLVLGVWSHTAAQGQTTSPEPADPAPSAMTSPGVSASSDDQAMLVPLPESLAVVPADVPTTSVEPGSAAGGVEVGFAMSYSLGHCGLWSPVDLDGSLWQPVGDQDSQGGPLDTDEEIGELINATEGQFTLTDPDHALFVTPLGSQIGFLRSPGALDYPLCV